MYVLQCFGADLTAGARGRYGWVPRVRDRVTDDATVYELGIPGETSGDLRARLGPEGRRRAHDWGLVVVVVQIGANDARVDLETGEPAADRETFGNNLRAMRETALHEIGADQVWFLDLLPVDDRGDPAPWAPGYGYRDEVVAEYDARLRAALPEESIVAVRDRLVGRTDTHLADGVRPNARGNEVIADAVVERLDETR